MKGLLSIRPPRTYKGAVILESLSESVMLQFTYDCGCYV